MAISLECHSGSVRKHAKHNSAAAPALQGGAPADLGRPGPAIYTWVPSKPLFEVHHSHGSPISLVTVI